MRNELVDVILLQHCEESGVQCFIPYLFIFITGGHPKDNPPFFCRVILDLAQYFHSASSRKCRQMSPREVTFSFDEREVTWLCFHAFQSCLRKKQSRYGELLKFLRKGLSQLRLPAEDFKAVIETDTSQHAVFKFIRWKHMQASCSIGTLSSPRVHQIRCWPQIVFAKVLMTRRRQESSSSLHMHAASLVQRTPNVFHKSPRGGCSTWRDFSTNFRKDFLCY